MSSDLNVAYRDAHVTVYHGDCLDILPSLPAGSVHAVITDPPYGLGFMGKEWDSGKSFVQRKPATRNTFDHVGGHHHPVNNADTVRTRRVEGRAYSAWCEQWASACLRVLAPGGYLLAFGGTRTWHHPATAIENAGFEIRDTIGWLYGSGFPKSLNVSRAIDKAAGAERPVVHRGDPVKRMIPGADQNRTGSWIKNNGRVYVPTDTAPATEDARRWEGWGTGLKPAFEPIIVARKPLTGTVATTVLEHGTGALNIDACRVPACQRPARIDHHEDTPGKCTYGAHGPGGGSHAAGFTDQGRWPPNIVLSHHDTCTDHCIPGCPVLALDEDSGLLRSGANPGRRHTPVFRDCYGQFDGRRDCTPIRGADAGGASRFFPAFRWQAKANSHERPRVDGISHPTVKPVDLIRWLTRLVTPPGGTIVDPFLGSGTTAEAARAEGFHCIGIERDPQYLPLVIARLRRNHPAASASSEAA